MELNKGQVHSLVSARGLRKAWVRGSWLPRRAHRVMALNGIDLDIAPRSTVGLVGPSGSGKSTLARCISGLDRPTEGWITLLPHDRVQLIPQDAGASLNARYSVLETVGEPLAVRGRPTELRRARSLECLAMVGLSEVEALRGPAQLSGGQRARLALARAIAALDFEHGPALMILDESLSNLDLSTQAHILNLVLAMQERHDLAVLLISHELAVVRHMADTVLAMSAGRLVAQC